MKIITTFFLVCCSVLLNAQSLISFVGGQADGAGGTHISWSMGEPVTATVKGEEKVVTQGFQQPEIITVIDPSLPCSANPIEVTNNGITEVRRFLKFGKISSFSKSSLVIVNRWGELIQEYTDGYNNEWDGTDGSGNKLPQGIYYYILTYGEDNCKEKGAVYILR